MESQPPRPPLPDPLSSHLARNLRLLLAEVTSEAFSNLQLSFSPEFCLRPPPPAQRCSFLPPQSCLETAGSLDLEPFSQPTEGTAEPGSLCPRELPGDTSTCPLCSRGFTSL